MRTWIGHQWRNFTDWLLLTLGTVESRGVPFDIGDQDLEMFTEGDLIRMNVSGTLSTFLVTKKVAEPRARLYIATINKFGRFILWCRDLKYKY